MEPKRYFTGKPCKHGHICERYTRSSICVECAAENRRQWGIKHPEKVRDGFLRWWSENQEAYRAKSKLWRMNNPEKKRDANRKWESENKAKVLLSQRKHYHANLKKMQAKRKKYRSENIDKERAYSAAYRKAKPHMKVATEARRRARKRMAAGDHKGSDILLIRKMQKDRCGYCRVKLNGKGEVDHIVALANGGSNYKTNLQILCKSCNSSKRARDPIEFAQSKGMLI